MAISHPAVGQYVANGAGVGSITVTLATEKTAHDVAADGNVMVSKIKGDNGSLAVATQQTSGLDKWLLNLYNYLKTADSSQWAETTIVLRAPNMGDFVNATGVSFKNAPERPYEAEGQKITWELMAADIQENKF